MQNEKQGSKLCSNIFVKYELCYDFTCISGSPSFHLSVLLILMFLFFRQTLKSLNTPINFFRLFLTNMLVTSLCIATNQHAEFLIRNGNFKSYARSDGTWERVAEAEMER